MEYTAQKLKEICLQIGYFEEWFYYYGIIETSVALRITHKLIEVLNEQSKTYSVEHIQ